MRDRSLSILSGTNSLLYPAVDESKTCRSSNPVFASSFRVSCFCFATQTSPSSRFSER